MKPVHKRRIGRHRRIRIQSENAKMLGRPGHLTGSHIPGPASGSADSLAFGQKRLAAAQLLLRTPTVRGFTFERHPGELLFGHVEERAHEVEDLAALVDDGRSGAAKRS